MFSLLLLSLFFLASSLFSLSLGSFRGFSLFLQPHKAFCLFSLTAGLFGSSLLLLLSLSLFKFFLLSSAFGFSHLLAHEGLCLERWFVTLIFLALVRISLCQVNLKTGVNNLMEPFADGDLGLVCLLDCHDSLNFPLTLLDCPLHIFVVAAHLPDESLVMLFLADNGRVLAFLNVVFDFKSTLLV